MRNKMKEIKKIFNQSNIGERIYIFFMLSYIVFASIILSLWLIMQIIIGIKAKL